MPEEWCSRFARVPTFFVCFPLRSLRAVPSICGAARRRHPWQMLELRDSTANARVPGTGPLNQRFFCKARGAPIPLLLSDSAVEWKDLAVGAEELRAHLSLTNGQSFSWHPVEGVAAEPLKPSDAENGSPSVGGVLHSHVILMQDTPTTTRFKVLTPLSCNRAEQVEEQIRYFFRLETRLASLMSEWSARHPAAFDASTLRRLKGLRLLRQDPVEAFFAFICSANNNVPRVTQLMDRLRFRYGQPLLATAFLRPRIDVKTRRCVGQSLSSWGIVKLNPLRTARPRASPAVELGVIKNSLYVWCAFPTVKSLAEAEAAELRYLGFGYRADRIIEAARQLVNAAAAGPPCPVKPTVSMGAFGCAHEKPLPGSASPPPPTACCIAFAQQRLGLLCKRA